MERVHDACHVEGLRSRHRKTIKRRVMDLNPLAAARRRGQGVLEAASTPSPGQFVADRPNAIWQIDHTIVDIVVVDEQYRRPIGRPVLTIAIDICTRTVADSTSPLKRRPAFQWACVFFTPSTTKQLGSANVGLICRGQ